MCQAALKKREKNRLESRRLERVPIKTLWERKRTFRNGCVSIAKITDTRVSLHSQTLRSLMLLPFADP